MRRSDRTTGGRLLQRMDAATGNERRSTVAKRLRFAKVTQSILQQALIHEH